LASFLFVDALFTKAMVYQMIVMFEVKQGFLLAMGVE